MSAPVDVLPLVDQKMPRNRLQQWSKVISDLGLTNPRPDLIIADAAPARKMLIDVSATYGNLLRHPVVP